MLFLCLTVSSVKIVHFVDIGGIDDLHCLNILFITILNRNSLGNREQPNVPLLIYYLTKRYLYNYLSYQLSSCYTISLELHKCSMNTCFASIIQGMNTYFCHNNPIYFMSEYYKQIINHNNPGSFYATIKVRSFIIQ